MPPIITLLCQQGGHAQALDYAKLITNAGIPLIVNFPSVDGYTHTAEAHRLVNPRVGAVVLIVSADFFPPQSKTARLKLDNSVFQELMAFAERPSRARLFVIVTDDEAVRLIHGTWMSEIQWLRDNSLNREKVLAELTQLAAEASATEDISAFANIKSILADIEPGCVIEGIGSERSASEKVSYEVFKCRHKIKKQGGTYYVHLHRGVTIINTVRHIQKNYPDVFASSDKFILLGIERGQTRLADRLDNIKTAFQTDNVEYIENIVSHLVVERMQATATSEIEVAGRRFIEPEVRLGIGTGNQPSNYSRILDWLAGARPGVLVLVGQGGIGKTWAMMNLRQSIATRAMQFEKQVQRTVVFMPSVDIIRGLTQSRYQPDRITLYDLYRASRGMIDEEGIDHRLTKETFYNAVELGSLVVFVDGLDEVVARFRGRFNVPFFFDDLKSRMSGDSDGKVIISCRNIFFDQDEYRFSHPFVETYELLAFDEGRRYRYFEACFGDFAKRRNKAVELSDKIAKLPDGLFLPFVLDMIKDLLLDKAEDVSVDEVEQFQSAVLNAGDPYDRIVGQFCHRETVKTSDPVRELSVDEQVGIFCLIARRLEGLKGQVDRGSLEAIISTYLLKKDVSGYVEQLRTHPFVSQEIFQARGVIDFRFDFMPEYFLMLDTYIGLSSDRVISESDVRVLNKFCGMNSLFSRGVAGRLGLNASDFRFKLIELYDRGREVILTSFAPEDSEILRPDSALAQFSFALLSLLVAFEGRDGATVGVGFTEAIREVFGEGNRLEGLAILDGFIREEERLRLDFRGLAVDGCLFQAFDLWDCTFDAQSVFTRCRFVACSGIYSKSTGVQHANFRSDCIFDADFEKVYAAINKKIATTEAQNIEAVRSFVWEFYRGGGFIRLKRHVVESKYGSANNYVPFKTMYALMKRRGIIEELSTQKQFVDVRVCRSAISACEKLITQGVLSSPLKELAIELRR